MAIMGSSDGYLLVIGWGYMSFGGFGTWSINVRIDSDHEDALRRGRHYLEAEHPKTDFVLFASLNKKNHVENFASPTLSKRD